MFSEASGDRGASALYKRLKVEGRLLFYYGSLRWIQSLFPGGGVAGCWRGRGIVFITRHRGDDDDKTTGSRASQTCEEDRQTDSRRCLGGFISRLLR